MIKICKYNFNSNWNYKFSSNRVGLCLQKGGGIEGIK